jgi:phage host-nuclease inhibitor protein Gam
MSKTFEQFRNDFEYLTAVIRSAQQQTQEGQMVTLGTLERDVKTLCDSVKTTTPSIARAIQPHMAELIAELDTLAEHLDAYKKRMKDK